MSAVIGHGTTDRTAPPTLQQEGEAGRGGEEVAQDEGGQGVLQEGGGSAGEEEGLVQEKETWGKMRRG